MFNFLFVTCLISYATAAPSYNGRIVGGYDTTITLHPWQLSWRYCNGGQHICGAVLIKENVALTAAHCTLPTISDCFQIRAGSTNNTYGGVLVYVDMSSILNHPNWTSGSAKNDIAIAKFPAFTIGGDIQLISLPSQGYTVPTNTSASLTGWGYLSNPGSVNDILQEVILPIRSRNSCNAVYGTITSGMICAGLSTSGNGICYGDSGGPLVVNSTLQGIASSFGGCGVVNRPAIYTRVAYYRNWIDSVS